MAIGPTKQAPSRHRELKGRAFGPRVAAAQLQVSSKPVGFADGREGFRARDDDRSPPPLTFTRRHCGSAPVPGSFLGCFKDTPAVWEVTKDGHLLFHGCDPDFAKAEVARG